MTLLAAQTVGLKTSSSPVVLVLVDGLSGDDADAGGLAAARALPKLSARARSGRLVATGSVVGGKDGEPFARDLGYRAIGTGRPASRHAIAEAITDVGYVEPLEAILGHAVANAGEVTDFMSMTERARCRVHVFGLVSDAPQSGSLAPLRAVLEAITDRELPVSLHAILDGRDMPKKTAWRALEPIVDLLENKGKIGTIMGRAYGLEATGDWQKTLAVYHALVMPGPDDDDEPRTAETPYDALSDAYEDGFSDFDMPPIRIGGFEGVSGQLSCEFGSAAPEWQWNADDVAVLVLPGADDAAQLVNVLCRADVPDAVAERLMLRGRKVRAFDAASLVSLAPVPGRPEIRAMFAKGEGPSLLSVAESAGRSVALFADRGRAHAEFALEGGRDRPGTIVVEAAGPLLDEARGAIEAGKADLVVVAIGSVEETLRGGGRDALRGELETIDGALDALAASALARGGAVLVTSAHATRLEPDAEGQLLPLSGAAPLLFVGAEGALREGGTLLDVAPTVLALLGVDRPAEMQGASLIVRAPDRGA